MQLTESELRNALYIAVQRIEACGGSVELTNAVSLVSDIMSTAANEWNKADPQAAERVREVIKAGK